MILNIPDPLAFFTELSEVAVIVNGKVTPEALYVLHKYEQKPQPSEIEYLSMTVPYRAENLPEGADRIDWYRQVYGETTSEYTPFPQCDNPDGVD